MTIAMLLAPGGAPAQPSGGLTAFAPAAQVYLAGIAAWESALLVTVIAAGAWSPALGSSTPQPAAGSAAPIAIADAIARRPMRIT
jgi:hypothetical protein